MTDSYAMPRKTFGVYNGSRIISSIIISSDGDSLRLPSPAWRAISKHQNFMSDIENGNPVLQETCSRHLSSFKLQKTKKPWPATSRLRLDTTTFSSFGPIATEKASTSELRFEILP